MRKLSITVFIATLILLALAAPTLAQRPFNKAEFVARRANLFEKIPDGIAHRDRAREVFPPGHQPC